MRLTISITAPDGGQDLLTLDLPQELTTADLKALVQSETGFSITSQHLYHNGQLLSNGAKSLQELRIGDGEMLAMHIRDMVGNNGVPSAADSRLAASRLAGPQAAQASSQAAGGQSGDGQYSSRGGPDPEMIRLQILGDPQAMATLRQQNPELADAAESSQRFRAVFVRLQRSEAYAEQARQREIAMLNDDPFNPESQGKIEELIRQEAVTENLQNALEHNPEAFGRVHMLYIDTEVNGHKVKAFVDSGAQATIMSPSCAEACGIMRLVDKRYAGIARGVGTAKIIGRVHGALIRIGTLHLACSFTVMEGKSVDLLLGLDMLKRHQACIDLRAGKLIIQTEEVPFLGEADIPKMEEEQRLEDTSVAGPSRTQIGANAGVSIQSPASSESTSTFSRPIIATTPSSSGPSSSTVGQPIPQSLPTSPPIPEPALLRAPSMDPIETVSAAAVSQLQQLGFSREEAVAALQATGGNVDYAAGLLFQER